MKSEDYQIIEDISCEDDNYFIEESEDIKSIIRKKLQDYYDGLEVALKLSSQMNLINNRESLNKLDNIADTFFCELITKLNLPSILNLSMVNRYYHSILKNNYDKIMENFLKQIPETESLEYCHDLLFRNRDLVKEITGTDRIIVRTGPYQRTNDYIRSNLILVNKIQSFKMVASCNDRYQIPRKNPIYLKIVIYNKIYYFYQDINKHSCCYNKVTSPLKIGCPNITAKQLLNFNLKTNNILDKNILILIMKMHNINLYFII
jgi:hypothetical protein